MDRTENNNKTHDLLEDGGTYKKIKTGPTNKLLNLLKKIKAEGGITEHLCKKMCPTGDGDVAPKFYGLPKIHKRDIPLRPIVSSRGSISCEVAKELARILRPLVGNSPHHIKNTGDFVQQMKGITLQANECITSCDVSALFTSVTIDPAINIIIRRLKLDQELQLRTTMKVEQIISLLEFCLKTTYLQFQGRFFEQLQGTAMRSPSAPLRPTSLWRTLRPRPLIQLNTLPRIWKRYVDGTCVVIESTRKEEFLEHINKIDSHIQFTTEDAIADGSIPFLDTIVMPQPDNSFLTSVYRKPTHTDLYLHWDSHYHLSAKFSVINTLKHRARTVCSNHHLLKEENDHLNKALKRCMCPAWALNQVNINQNKNKQGTNKNKTNINSKKPYVVVPYMQGLSESCKNICRKHGLEMYFRGSNTIRDLLLHPKDRDTILQKSGVIYRYKCGKVDCVEEYIGE